MAVVRAILTASLLLAGCAHREAKVVQPTDSQVGEAIYMTNCSACHDQDDGGRTPSKVHLRSLNEVYIRTTLTEGVMKPLAEHLSPEEIDQLIFYLTKAP